MRIFTIAVLLLAVLFSASGCKTAEDQVTQPETLPTAATMQTTVAAKETEPFVTEPEPEPEDRDFVRIIDYIPSVRQSLAYATKDNFTEQIIYDFQDAYLRYGTVKKLAKVARDLERQGMGLLIWDGFRPVSAQAKLWDVCPDPVYVSPPGTGIQSHCRGVAVDLTLIALNMGTQLEMPTEFDNFTALADRDYADVSAEAAANALLLEQTMEKYGFSGYSGEWWHFSDTDSYPIEENFDPTHGA